MAKEKTGSSRPLQPPLIYIKVGRVLVDVGMISCRSPTKNWKALDCQNYSLSVTSKAFRLTAYLKQDLIKLLLTNSCNPPKVLVSKGSEGTTSPH